MIKDKDKRIERAQIRTIFNAPFFAAAVARLPVIWDDSVDTACTDGDCIRWSPKYMDTLEENVPQTVLCHEAMHNLFEHIRRCMELEARYGAEFDWDLANQAADHEVNNILDDFNLAETGKGRAEPFPFPQPREAYCCNPAFKGMPFEQIYGIMHGKRKGPGKPKNAPNGKPGPNSMPSFGQMQKPKAKPGQTQEQHQAKQQAQANSWRNQMIQAVELAKGQGTVPGGLARYVNELIKPTVPWWEIVRNWIREQCEDDWTWAKPNPYYDDSGFILPSLHSEKIGPMVFAKDTSGSVDQQLLATFIGEEQNALDEMRPSKLVDICCDARITKESEYRPGDTISGEAPGGGGTNFTPVFDRIAQFDQQPKCLVYLTDLQGSFPAQEPDYPVLWVVWGGATAAPFGEVVNV